MSDTEQHREDTEHQDEVGQEAFIPDWRREKLEDIERMKERVREMEEEAAKLREMQSEADTIQQNSRESKEDVDARSVFVGNVDYGASPEEIQNHFRSCGAINRVTILLDKFTGHPKGFAYVEFAEPSMIAQALVLNESVFRGRNIKVTPKRTNLPGINRGGGGRGRGRGRGGFRGGFNAPRGGYVQDEFPMSDEPHEVLEARSLFSNLHLSRGRSVHDAPPIDVRPLPPPRVQVGLFDPGYGNGFGLGSQYGPSANKGYGAVTGSAVSHNPNDGSHNTGSTHFQSLSSSHPIYETSLSSSQPSDRPDTDDNSYRGGYRGRPRGYAPY